MDFFEDLFDIYFDICFESIETYKRKSTVSNRTKRSPNSTSDDIKSYEALAQSVRLFGESDYSLGHFQAIRTGL